MKDMTKSDARAAVNKIVTEVNAKRDQNRVWTFGEFVKEVYTPYYTRKWKASTRENNVNRVDVHLMSELGNRELKTIKRDELQDLLDFKAREGKVERERKRIVPGGTRQPLSASVVAHLRFDLRAIFAMAMADGIMTLNPASLLFTPKEAVAPERRVMTIKEVQTVFGVLDLRERLIAKLAILAGMRVGEIFALKWGRLTATYADIRQRVYRGKLDSPKTNQSIRKAALSEGVLREIEAWREFAPSLADDAFVFPSERMYALKKLDEPTPIRKENCWTRNIQPKLEKVGLEWANFLVMRRTHATLMRQLKADPHQVAAQLGHSVDVSLNVYSQSPVETRAALVNQFEQSLLVM